MRVRGILRDDSNIPPDNPRSKLPPNTVRCACAGEGMTTDATLRVKQRVDSWLEKLAERKAA